MFDGKKFGRVLRCLGIIVAVWFLTSPGAAGALTVTPNTWNIIGLDSNVPASGPYRFPVGAKVCGGAPGASDTAAFVWDTGGTDNGTYINLRPGSANPVGITFDASGCADAYFEVEVSRTSSAFDQSRRYHITAGGVSTPIPRELYVEHLISQSRNGINDIKLNGASVPAGGSMNLMVGNTYTIELDGHTATAGYNQFEEFINFPNTIFEVISVNTTYTNTPPYLYVSNPNPGLYADACLWENDPNSPYYRSCVGGDSKAGGTVTTTFTVKIIGGGGSSQALGSLLYDFSGSSYHYNGDYSTGARIANIIDPATLTISKSFSPNPTNAGGASTLIFTLTNPNAGVVSGLTFTDVFPTSPASLTLADTVTANTCGGSLTDQNGGALAVGSAGIKLTGGAVAANGSCTVQVNVTPPATGSYANTSGPLFAGLVNTGKTASTTLTVNNAPPQPAPVCGLTMAQWTFTGATVPNPAPSSKATDVATATATFNAGGTGGTNAIDNANGNPAAPSWQGGNFQKIYNTTTNPPTSSTAPYFELSVDSSKYTNVTLTVNDYATANWGSSNALYAWSSANGGAFAATTPATGALVKQTWSANLSFAAAATGATTTQTFRIGAAGSTNNNSQINLDTITITGCAVPNPPTITKNFSPNPVAVVGTSTLSFGVTNPNANVALSGISFTDALVSGLTVTTGSSVQCGGTLTRTAPATISFSGGALAPAASCVITATVTATTAGPHNNVSGFIYSSQTGTNTGASGVAKASLIALSPPDITKQFAPNSILSGGTSTLTFLITNPNQNNSVSGVSFTDNFPSGMTVATPSSSSTSGCGAPVFAPVAGATSLSFTNGTIAAGGTCLVSVNTLMTAATGTYTNTSGNVSHIVNSATINGNTASAQIVVTAPHPAIFLFKEAASSDTAATLWNYYLAVPAGGNVYYQFTVQNAGDVPLTSVQATDNDITPPLSTANCRWYYGYDYNDRVPANLISTPTFTLEVANNANNRDSATCVYGPISAVAGTHTNNASVTGFYGGSPYTDTDWATYATTGLTVAKSASPAYFTQAGDAITYSYTVTNTGAATLTGPVAVADNKTTPACPLVNYLASNQTVTCTAAYTVASADVTNKYIANVATASTATVGSIPQVLSSAQTLTVPLVDASKINDVSNQVPVYGTYHWTITVRNQSSAGQGANAAFTPGQAILLDSLPASGATYTVSPSATNVGGTSGTIACALVSGPTLSCAASGLVTVPPGGSFTELITATTNTSGTLVNAGCKIAPGFFNTLLSGCTNTVSVKQLASLLLVKSATVWSDPVSGTTVTAKPKAIPGAVITYTINVSNNAGAGSADAVVITDSLASEIGAGRLSFRTQFGDDANACAAGYGIVVDGVCKSNATGDDNADWDGTTPKTVTVTLPSLAGGASSIIKFQVIVQ